MNYFFGGPRMLFQNIFKITSRRGCASRRTVLLSTLPSHPAVDCAHCERRLRLWPDQEMAFTCDQCEYESCAGWAVVRWHNLQSTYNLHTYGNNIV